MTKICRYEAHKLKGKNSRNGNYAAIFIAKHLIRVMYGRSAAITAVRGDALQMSAFPGGGSAPHIVLP